MLGFKLGLCCRPEYSDKIYQVYPISRHTGVRFVLRIRGGILSVQRQRMHRTNLNPLFIVFLARNVGGILIEDNMHLPSRTIKASKLRFNKQLL